MNPRRCSDADTLSHKSHNEGIKSVITDSANSHMAPMSLTATREDVADDASDK